MNWKNIIGIGLVGFSSMTGLSGWGQTAELKREGGNGRYLTESWVGSNYTPAYAVNQVQMWHDFRPEVIDRELAAARKYFGLTSLSVYLHNIVFDAEKEKFLQRIDEFLAICAKHEIKPGFIFFDDCWNHKEVTLDSPAAVKGRHNGRWAALQDCERKDENLPKFKAYVQAVINAHREDKRVLWWEVYNEPNLKDPFTVKIRELAYGWAKECKPVQPVIACWDDHPFTDIVNAHNYTAAFHPGGGWDRQAELNPAKGTLFTEAGARWYAPKGSSGSPTEIIHWLQRRREQGKYVPGVYLCWELMAGNSNCRWYWGTPDNAPEPTNPWCGLLWPDCTPVSLAEAEAIHRYTTGQKRALFFDDFEEAPTPPVQTPAYNGWQLFGNPSADRKGVLSLASDMKMIVGGSDWRDYVMEAAVLLKGEHGNAGLVFRVNEPGPGMDQMKGYYAGFDTKTLYLGKLNNNWHELQKFDLTKLDCKIVPGVWNRLRVAVKGNHIQVWLNPLHNDPGLRIEFTDEQEPILSGSVGVRSREVEAWIDDLVVLPAE